MIFFIITVGLFIVISFPFDVTNSFSKGSASIAFDSFYGIPFPNFSYYANAGFHPFLNLNLLNGGNFLTGVGILVLCSLPVGVFIFLLYDTYEKINHFPKRVYCKIMGKACTTKMDKITAEGVDPQEFLDYIERLKIIKNLIFYDTIRQISVALLYGSQTLLFMILPLFLFAGEQQLRFGWLIISLLFCVFFGIIYSSYERRYNKIRTNVLQQYKEKYRFKQSKLS
jgi:hypothetical protein